MYLKDLHTPPRLGGYSLNPSTEGTKLMLYKSTKVLAGVCCALLICMFTFFNLYGQQNTCIELHTPPGADCGDWEYFSKEITLSELGPVLGSCEFIVSYYSRKCTVTVGNCTTVYEQFRYGGLMLWTNRPGCSELLLLLLPDYPNSYELDKDAYALFQYHAIDHLMDINYLEHFASLTPQERLELACDGQYPNCDMPVCTPYKAQYISGKCNDMCIDFSAIPFTINIQECDTEDPICCVVERKYCTCFDQFGNPIRIEKSYNSIIDPGECSGIGNQYDDCKFSPLSYKYYIPCFGSCPIMP